MSRDFTVIAPHQLSFVNTKDLAYKLSELFNMNVFTIFTSFIDLKKIDPFVQRLEGDALKHLDYTDYYILDKLVIDAALPNMYLEYDEYTYTWLKMNYPEAEPSRYQNNFS